MCLVSCWWDATGVYIWGGGGRRMVPLVKMRAGRVWFGRVVCKRGAELSLELKLRGVRSRYVGTNDGTSNPVVSVTEVC